MRLILVTVNPLCIRLKKLLQRMAKLFGHERGVYSVHQAKGRVGVPHVVHVAITVTKLGDDRPPYGPLLLRVVCAPSSRIYEHGAA